VLAESSRGRKPNAPAPPEGGREELRFRGGGGARSGGQARACAPYRPNQRGCRRPITRLPDRRRSRSGWGRERRRSSEHAIPSHEWLPRPGPSQAGHEDTLAPSEAREAKKSLCSGGSRLEMAIRARAGDAPRCGQRQPDVKGTLEGVEPGRGVKRVVGPGQVLHQPRLKSPFGTVCSACAIASGPTSRPSTAAPRRAANSQSLPRRRRRRGPRYPSRSGWRPPRRSMSTGTETSRCSCSPQVAPTRQFGR
jgi:hypothetical protein